MIAYSAVTGHTVSGIDVSDAIITGPSNLTMNRTDSECGVTIACADIESLKPPSIASAALCDTSLQSGSGVPGISLGICALD